MKKRIWLVSLVFCFLTGCAIKADRGTTEMAGGQDAGQQEDAGQQDDTQEDAGQQDDAQEGGQQNDTQQEVEEQNEAPQSDERGLTLRAQNVTAEGCTIVYEQHGGAPSGSELLTGSWYRIERKEQDEWVEVPYAEGIGGEIGWNDTAWIISMEGSVEFEESWGTLYGELPPGTYRIVKEIMDFRGTGDYDVNDYYAEFTL